MPSVSEIIRWLERRGSRKNREGMARYGITSADRVLGISVGTLRAYAKTLGRDHQLALDLWKTRIYEARMLAAFVDEPDHVTVAQMNAWCRDFDNWAICDTVCFALFDRTPLAWGRLAPWSRAMGEFQKRAAFALLASLALHDRKTPDERFASELARIEAASDDSRNFVKKGVLWALRGVGSRSPTLHRDALELARRLTTSEAPSARWIGQQAARELTKAGIRRGRSDRAR